MNQTKALPLGPMLLSLLVGAAGGALFVALRAPQPPLPRDQMLKRRSAARGIEAVAGDEEGLLEDWKLLPASGLRPGTLNVSPDDLPG